LDLRTTIEIRSSPGLLEPGVVGLLRPIILLPAGILERLAPVELEALLAHELCHVRRRDNLRSAVHMIVEALFWFHPLVWWIGARLMEERERACDEDVLRGGSDPGVYARAILNVCRHYVESPLACVSGVTGADLKKRIEKIMARELTQNLQLPKKLLLVAGACAAFTMPVAIGLLHAQSQFEVASIRPHQGPLHRVFDFSSSGPRLRLEGYSAPLLIMEAYNLKSYQVSLASVPGVLEAAGEGAILAGQAEPHCECSMAVSGDGMA
jgi:beta-lactamase regulating signal transducer with metallopeptidase domain